MQRKVVQENQHLSSKIFIEMKSVFLKLNFKIWKIDKLLRNVM